MCVGASLFYFLSKSIPFEKGLFYFLIASILFLSYLVLFEDLFLFAT